MVSITAFQPHLDAMLKEVSKCHVNHMTEHVQKKKEIGVVQLTVSWLSWHFDTSFIIALTCIYYFFFLYLNKRKTKQIIWSTFGRYHYQNSSSTVYKIENWKFILWILLALVKFSRNTDFLGKKEGISIKNVNIFPEYRPILKSSLLFSSSKRGINDFFRLQNILSECDNYLATLFSKKCTTYFGKCVTNEGYISGNLYRSFSLFDSLFISHCHPFDIVNKFSSARARSSDSPE